MATAASALQVMHNEKYIGALHRLPTDSFAALKSAKQQFLKVTRLLNFGTP